MDEKEIVNETRIPKAYLRKEDIIQQVNYNMLNMDRKFTSRSFFFLNSSVQISSD